MGSWLRDTRNAFRALLRIPGYLAPCVVTLGLGIGATTLIFAVVDRALWRPLPYADADRIVQVQHRLPVGGTLVPLRVTEEDFLQWNTQAVTMLSLALHRQAEHTLTTADGPVRLFGSRVSANFFRLLGHSPHLGREFREDELATRGSPIIILSHRTWATYFRSDPHILDTSIRLDDESYEVVGVMAADFVFPRDGAEFWMPAARSLTNEAGGGQRAGTLLARLGAEISLDQATAEAKAITARLRPTFRGEVEVWTLHSLMVSGSRRALLILLGSVGFVLLIVCANVANLVLARGTSRKQDVAIRVALGSGRLALIRHVLTETVLLGMVGGLLGVLIAWWGCGVVRTFGAGLAPRLDQVTLDGRVLLVAIGVSLMSGLLVGGMPAVGYGRSRASRSLYPSAPSPASNLNPGRRQKAHQLLVVTELALTFVLLVGAGLLMGSFVALMDVNPGYDSENVLTFQVALPEAHYPNHARQTEFIGALLSRLGGVAGVRSVGMSTDLPFVGGALFEVPAVAGPPPSREEMLRRLIQYRLVSDGFFRAMGMPLVKGRAFVDGEAGNVVVVSESLVRREFPGRDPIGLELTLLGESRRIVGVVADVRMLLDRDPPSGAYLPYQRYEGTANFTNAVFAVQVSGDPLRLVPSARRLVASVDSTIPIFNIATMEERVFDSVARPRFYALTLGGLAIVAFAVAFVGVYGVLSYLVTQRTGEIGLRIALGARPANVILLIIRQGMSIVGAGLALGLAGAIATTRYLASFLFGLTPLDPFTFAGVGFGLGVAALLACYLPARAATRTDPVAALRAL